MNDRWRRSFPSRGGVYGHTENQDVPNVFLEILPIYVTFVCLLWEYLVKPIQKIVYLQKTLVSISMQKICFINHFFRQILQRYYILTLNTLGIPGHTHQMFQAKYHILCFFAANSINLDEYKWYLVTWALWCGIGFKRSHLRKMCINYCSFSI